MASFEQKFLDFFSKFKFHRNIYIAYSGGIDSSILLYLSYKFFDRNKFFIRAIHVNHGYTNRSYSWSIFCKNICDEYKIPICIFNSDFSKKTNLEQEFRFIRFNFFFNLILKNSILLLAHNNDDFLETMFLRLFRGSNLFSIFGIQCANKLGKLNILRPLINFSKNDIKEIACLNNIRHINDFSNFDIKFNRNYIRSGILPLVLFKWPNCHKVIFKSFILSNNFYKYFYFRCVYFLNSKGFNLDYLNINYLFLLPYLLRCEIIKLWIKSNNFNTPSYSQFREVDKLLHSNNYNIGFIFIKDYFLKKKKNYLFIEDKWNSVKHNNISVYLDSSNTHYIFYRSFLFFKFEYFLIKNFFIIKYFNAFFLILGLFYHKRFSKHYFIFKVLY